MRPSISYDLYESGSQILESYLTCISCYDSYRLFVREEASGMTFVKVLNLLHPKLVCINTFFECPNLRLTSKFCANPGVRPFRLDVRIG